METLANDIDSTSESCEQQQASPRRLEYRPWMVFTFMGILALGLIYLYFRDPTQHTVFIPCAFNAVTGQHCPGCGTTRAVHAALHGDFRQALAWNALTSIVLVIAIGFGLWYSWLIVVRKQKTLPPFSRKLTYALLVVMIIFWIARNLPFEPFSWLAPHDLTTGPPQ